MNRLHLWSQYILKKENIYKFKNFSVYDNPCLNKIIINLNLKDANLDFKQILPGLTALEIITYQKPNIYYSKKSIASFKLRKNSIIGCKLTLQKKQLFNTLDLFVSIVLAKTQNFKGFSKINIASYNQINIGIIDLAIFPQINENQKYFLKKLGCTLTFITNAKNKKKDNIVLNQYQIPKNEI